MPGRLTIGLYNSYDPRRFGEAHRRALVRAAPLALAFDANLAAFGFPFDELAAHGGRTAENRSRGAVRGASRGEDAPQRVRNEKRGQGEPVELRTPVEIAEYVAATTSVAGAKTAPEGDISHFVRLAREGRFAVFELPKKGFPPQLGALVLTTEHARGPKAMTPLAVAQALAHGRSQLLLFGLGPHGTPPEVREAAAGELDVTGKGIGLETATAMGAVVAAIAAHAATLT